MTNKAKNTAPGKDFAPGQEPGQEPGTKPEVLMLMGTQCAFCGPMMQALTELMKAGEISRLEILNIEQNMVLAAELGVRSVPWLRIGPFELAGARDKGELHDWLQRAGSEQGLQDYMTEVLSEGNIEAVRKLLQKQPDALSSLIALMADADAKINVRLGVGVIIEEMAATPAFAPAIPILLDYLKDQDARVRSDACHYLSLTGDASLIPAIEPLLNDDSAEVREIAEESLQALRQDGSRDG